MASLGIKKVDDLIGQTNLLRQKKNNYYKIKGLDLSPILYRYSETPSNYFNSSKQNEFLKDQIDIDLLKQSIKTIKNYKNKTKIITEIKNTDRAVGTILSSEITKKYGSK
jgi:glutamate synthase (NADPH/NADH) large chain